MFYIRSERSKWIPGAGFLQLTGSNLRMAIGQMFKAEKLYETVMNDAKEHVYIYALRHAMDTRVLGVEFDAGRGSGPHEQHTLTISVLNSPLSATAKDIPHEWLSAGTGFIDSRFSKSVGTLLQELAGLARQAGQVI